MKCRWAQGRVDPDGQVSESSWRLAPRRFYPLTQPPNLRNPGPRSNHRALARATPRFWYPSKTLLTGLDQGRPRQPPRRRPRLRPLPRRQTVQRQAQRPATRTLPPSPGRLGSPTAQRDAVVALEEPGEPLPQTQREATPPGCHALNTPLSIAYYPKEDLRQFWDQPNKRTARRVLRVWMARARVSGIRMLERFADILEKHEEGILAYYGYPISTGLWKAPTPRSRPCNLRLKGSETANSTNSRSWAFTNPNTK